MTRKTRITLIALCLLALFGYRQWRDQHREHPAASAASAEAPATPVTRRLGAIAFSPCTLAPSFGVQTVEAQCGSFEVPENRDQPGGRRIRLAIAWLPARGEAQPDPVFLLAGGPGQSARESFPVIAPAFEEIRKTRDIVLVDQRGTGASNPLVCREPKQAQANQGNDDDDGIARMRATAEHCAKALAGQADLRYYGTSDAVLDLDAVRAAIGAPSLNLIGISYGTRVAQQYAKRFPTRARTVTLDGVVPNSLVLGEDFAANLESSLDRQFARCTGDKTCRERLGDPRQKLDALMAKLRVSPPTVRYRDAITGESREGVLRAGNVAGLARMFAYAPQVAALLPLELNEAAQGRYEPLMALSQLLSGTLGDQIMMGMQLSVVCGEDAAELRVNPADESTLLGTGMVTGLQAQCAVWPTRPRPVDFRAPLSSKVPVLLMSGEFDPVTPPRYGDEVARHLVNGRHLVVHGQGHNVLPVGCMPRLFAQFVDRADAKSLDAACLDKVPYAPPFTGFYGWEP